jgi:hypothetical protein
MTPSSITILHSSFETYLPLLFAVYFTDNIFTNLPFCMKNLLFQNQSCFEKTPVPKKENEPIFWLFCVSQCIVVTQAADLVPSTWKCRIASRPTLLLYKKFSSKDHEKIMLCSYCTSVLSKKNYSLFMVGMYTCGQLGVGTTTFQLHDWINVSELKEWWRMKLHWTINLYFIAHHSQLSAHEVKKQTRLDWNCKVSQPVTQQNWIFQETQRAISHITELFQYCWVDFINTFYTSIEDHYPGYLKASVTLNTCNNHNSQHIGCSISHCFKEKPWEHCGIRLSHQLSTIQHLLNGGDLIMEPHTTISMELWNHIAKYTHNHSSNNNPCT